MFGRKQEPPKPCEPELTYDGEYIVSYSFWRCQSQKYPLLDELVGKGYKIVAMGGMDGYIVVLEKPTKVMECD